MALETGTYISDLVSTNPTSTDPKAEGDDHIRLLKSTIKTTFPNVAGAVTPTHTELNYVDGVTSPIQTQLDSKAPLANPTFTGSVNVPAPTELGHAVNKFYADGLALSSALPGQAGNAGKFVTTDGTTAYWADASQLLRVERTTNVALTASDKGKLIDITSGTFTQTFNASSSLGDGWFVYIRNSGSGDITLDPNSSETIDGLTSYVMYSGEIRLIQCDGAELRTLLISGSNYQEFLSSGTWTKPAGVTWVYVEAIGGGGGGRSAAFSGDTCQGGGGGEFVSRLLRASDVAATVTVTVGAGGAGGPIGGDAGSNGGNSSFGAHVTARGGAGGRTGAANTAYTGLPGAGAGNNIESVGGAIYPQAGPGGAPNRPGINTIYGGAGGGGCNGTDRAGGTSLYGGNGGDAVAAAAGQNGSQPGGGGGANSSSAHVAGSGGAGRVRVWAW